MKPSEVGRRALRLRAPFAAAMGVPFLQEHWETLPLISLHFPLLLSPPFVQDFSGTKSAWIVGDFESTLTVKCWLTPFYIPQKHSQSHFPASPQVTVIVAIKSDHCPAAPPQVPGPRLSTKRINSPHPSGSWGITRKAGPASALMMLQKHVPGETPE